MEPGGPWRDPRQGYLYGLGSPMSQQQRPDPAAAVGGVLKRSLGEIERWQHQRQVAMQQELYMRAVRQRTATPLASVDVAALLAGGGGTSSHHQHQPLIFSGSSLGGLASPSSTLSSLTTASRAAMPLIQQHVHRQAQFVPPPSVQAHAYGVAARTTPPPAPSSAATTDLSILQELEKQLLDDDDDDAEPAMSGTGSTLTSSEWEDTIQRLNSITAASAPSPPLAPAVTTPNYNAGMTRSPSNSSTSTASSSASCSPPISATTSRQLLSEAAVAIADGYHEAAAAHLATLKRGVNPRGGDAEQRLLAMMVGALSSRIAPSACASSQHLAELCGAEHRTGCQFLHDISPCFRLALDAANLAIVEAVAGHRAVHLVDFDISGPQHAALIQCLADRRVPGTSLKVTAVTDPTSPFTQSLTTTLSSVGDRLKKLAERAGIEYRFRVVSCRAAEIDASKLGCEPGEALAVNLAFAVSHVPDESVSPANPRDELLRRVRALGPQIVTLVEQELNSNTAPLATRFTDACAHYGAILDSLDATAGRESADKARAEEAVAKMAANVVGREGADRLQRCEVFGKWRARFGMAGFRPVALATGIADQVMARIGAYSPPGLVVNPENGVLRLGWMGRVVTVASAWR